MIMKAKQQHIFFITKYQAAPVGRLLGSIPP